LVDLLEEAGTQGIGDLEKGTQHASVNEFRVSAFIGD